MPARRDATAENKMHEKSLQLVDSHCHLPMIEKDLVEVLDAAKANGITHFLSVAVLLSDHEALTKIAEKYEQVSISAGLHPNELPNTSLDVALLDQQAAHPKVVAIGETGLDYYRSDENTVWQHERFCQHMDCARRHGKPLIIHTRAAKADTIKLMRSQHANDIGGVMHCFTEDWDTAKAALDLGFYISFSGIVTFKNAVELQSVAQKVPMDRILIETDAPYLAPVPHRGKPNEPAFVRHVAEFIAQLRGISVETIGAQTTQNFYKLFKP